jgi:hypothetical protein
MVLVNESSGVEGEDHKIKSSHQDTDTDEVRSEVSPNFLEKRNIKFPLA